MVARLAECYILVALLYLKPMDNTEFRRAKALLDFYDDTPGECSFSCDFIDELVETVDRALDLRITRMRVAESAGLEPTLKEHGLLAADLANSYPITWANPPSERN
tara:strand:+ start:157 stop:474 length:318 start_codon:yes stop_codon:yes gene_type:complete